MRTKTTFKRPRDESDDAPLALPIAEPSVAPTDEPSALHIFTTLVNAGYAKRSLGVLALFYYERMLDRHVLSHSVLRDLRALLFNINVQMRAPGRSARASILDELLRSEQPTVKQLRRTSVLSALFTALDDTKSTTSSSVVDEWHKLTTQSQWALFHATDRHSPLDRTFEPW